MADSSTQTQIELLKRILAEVKQTNELLSSLLKTTLKESKENAKEARDRRRKMLLEAKKILESPNREAMILEELRKRGHKV